MPTSQPGRRYILRSRIRCRICQRRMCGIWRPTATGTSLHLLPVPARPRQPPPPRRPPRPRPRLPPRRRHHGRPGPVLRPVRLRTRPRRPARHPAPRHRRRPRRTASPAASPPDHRTGPHRHRRTRPHHRTRSTRRPGRPRHRAYRARIRARYAELYAERTRTETDLAALHAATPAGTDPALLDQLPTIAAALADAPDKIKAALIAAFDISALYNREDHQVTIRASLTQDTPRTIAALLTDPRTDDDTWHGTPPASTTPAPATVSHLGQGTPVARIFRNGRIFRGNRSRRSAWRDAGEAG